MGDINRKVINELVTDDRLLSNKPCFIHSVTMCAEEDKKGWAYIRNGHDSGGEIALEMEQDSGREKPFRYSPPLYMSKGLFIDMKQRVESITIQWETDPLYQKK